MDQPKKIKIVAIVGNGFCTSSEDGQAVHDVVATVLRQGEQVLLSFEDVEDLTSAFLNAALGQLYSEFTEEEIRARLLPPLDATPEHLDLLKRVVNRAKEFFKAPTRFEKATREALGEDDDEPVED